MARDLRGDRSPGDAVRARVAQADRLRRARAESGRLWRMAPPAAGICLALAGAGRWAGWSPLVPVASIVVAAVALGLFAAAARRDREVSDAAAAVIDARASLDGELRSAHWFAHHAGHDPWIEFHLRRAADRIQTIDWPALYPAPRSARAKLATIVMAAGALAVALILPGRAGAIASGAAPVVRPVLRTTRPPLEALPPELRKKIEDLLSAAESGRGRALTGAEVRGLLAQLDELRAGQASKNTPLPDAQRGGAKAPTGADLKDLAERAKRDSEIASLQPDVRDALADVSEQLSDDAAAETRNSTPKDPRDAMGAKDAQEGNAGQSTAAGDKDDASAQSVKDASGGGGIGVIMMTGDSTSSAEPGLGLGGGSEDRKGGGHLVNLGAALRHETIEAGVDSAGERLPTAVRRRTEHGTATIGYAHTAPASVERGRSTAPPPVPEARRAAVRAYFIRRP